MKDPFRHRHHALGVKTDLIALAKKFKADLQNRDALRRLIDDTHPADVADAMNHLTDEEDLALYRNLTSHEKAEVLDEVNDTTLKRLVAATTKDEFAEILPYLPVDEAADVLGAMPQSEWEGILEKLKHPLPLRTLLKYGPRTAGGLMSSGFVAVASGGTVGTAVACFRAHGTVEPIFYIYFTDGDGKLDGQIDLWTLLSHPDDKPISDLLDREVVCVPVEMDQEQVAMVFTRYDLTALPVTDKDHVLLGVITADDIIDVIQEESAEDMAHMAGTDAHELEKKSPAQIAMMRMPWIMSTMLIELLAGFVIKAFDQTLAQVLLLASFMPIISAISGNTGLQSAAIIIRGLSSGHVQIAHWKHAMLRQMSTTVILGAACGIGLGLIGFIWSGKIGFGILTSVGMFASVNIAGAVGTAIPLLSKRLGFDPAMTAGPFETAFQDVVGISIFLGMATVLLPYLK